MRTYLPFWLLVLLGCGSADNRSESNSTFKIETPKADGIAEPDKLQRLEIQSGFKNITLGKSLEEFNLGSDWTIKTKGDLFGRTFGDSIISASDSIYHEQIGESKIDVIDLTFINRILMIIEVRMSKGTYPKGMLTRSNLLPLLIEKYGEPNRIPLEQATFSEQKGVLFFPRLRLLKDVQPSISALDELVAQSEGRKATPKIPVASDVRFKIAAWQSKSVRMEYIEEEYEFEESSSKTRTETLRYYFPRADSLDVYIYEKAQRLEKEIENGKRTKEADKL